MNYKYECMKVKININLRILSGPKFFFKKEFKLGLIRVSRHSLTPTMLANRKDRMHWQAQAVTRRSR